MPAPDDGFEKSNIESRRFAEEQNEIQRPRSPIKPEEPNPWIVIASSLKNWIATLVIPVPISLGAFFLAAFLIFPAFKGLSSGSTIRQLEEEKKELQQALDAAKSQSIKLDRELAQRDIQLLQRQQSKRNETNVGLYIAPILSLEPKKAVTPDLISINLSQTDQAILVFALPRYKLQEVEFSVYQDTRLVWSQSISIPSETLFNQNLVTFVLSRSVLPPGSYRLKVDGNPTSQKIGLNQFDLSIEA